MITDEGFLKVGYDSGGCGDESAILCANYDSDGVMRIITKSEYLEATTDSFVRDTIGRYKRGDFDYIEALERISVYYVGLSNNQLQAS